MEGLLSRGLPCLVLLLSSLCTPPLPSPDYYVKAQVASDHSGGSYTPAANILIYTEPCTLHTEHCTQHTPHSTLHTAYCTLHTEPCTLKSTLHNKPYTFHIEYYTILTALCTLNISKGNVELQIRPTCWQIFGFYSFKSQTGKLQRIHGHHMSKTIPKLNIWST